MANKQSARPSHSFQRCGQGERNSIRMNLNGPTHLLMSPASLRQRGDYTAKKQAYAMPIST